jgi:hypothetical protein
MNAGNTPAQVTKVALRYITIDRLEDLPDEPDYGPGANLGGMLLVPQDSFGKDAPLSPKPSLSQPEAQAIENEERHLYAFGFVEYKDVYRRTHETRVGYRYQFPQGGLVSFQKASFQRYGKTAYNKAT